MRGLYTIKGWTTFLAGMLLVGGLQAAPVSAPAGQSAATAPRPKRSIPERIAHQKQRIERAQQKGKLDQAQAEQLMAKVDAIENEYNSKVQANDGKLSKEDRKKIRQELKASYQAIKAAVGPTVKGNSSR